MISLKCTDLAFDYASGLVLENISLEVRAGELLVLLGANGAGKSTLLHLLAGQLAARSGEIEISGAKITTMSRRELARQVSLMPQLEDRHSQLRVIDVVSLGRTPHCGWWRPMTQHDDDVVQESLQATGLISLSERRIDELSGGEWRRMILARSLAQQSPILLLDEPTAGLDLKYQLDVLNRVRSMIKERNLVGVVTLHDLNHASVYGDRIALLSERTLIAVGTPAEVLSPEWIQRAFGVSVSVIPHPVHGNPFIVPRYESGSLLEADPVEGIV